MKYSFYLVFFLWLCCYSGVWAQGENNHWHFGYGSHIDFNATAPVYALNSNRASLESCATVSDAEVIYCFYYMSSGAVLAKGEPALLR